MDHRRIIGQPSLRLQAVGAKYKRRGDRENIFWVGVGYCLDDFLGDFF